MMRGTVLGMLCGVLLFQGNAGAAPDRFGKFDLGVNVSGAFNENTAEDDGWVGLSLSYGVLNWLAIGVEGGWQDANTSSPGEELGVATLMGDVILRLPIEDWPFVPYGVVGLGMMAAYITDEEGVAPTDNGDDVDDKTFAMKYGIGFDFWFQDVWYLNFEAAFYDGGPDLPNSSIAGDDVEFWTVGGGAKLFLN